MPTRLCLDCGRLTTRTDSRCPAHASAWHRRHLASERVRERTRGRPSARQRGYDGEHDRMRERLLPAAIGKPCPRCGKPMIPDPTLPGLGLDLGHTIPLRVDPRSRADRIEHARCNRGERD